MLDEFLNHARNQLEILDEAVTKGDTNLVEQEAHSLKDAAGNLGAKHVADIAHRLEVSARSRELTLAEQMIASLRNGLKQLEEYISGSPTDEFVGRS